MALSGIDVSKYNGMLDYGALRDAGVKFAFVKATQGHSLGTPDYLFRDSCFAENARGFASVGIPIGVYHFFTGSTIEDTADEAVFCVDEIKKAGIGELLYIVCDAENYSNQYLLGLSRRQLTQLVQIFAKIVEECGFKFCLYTNTDHLRNFISLEELGDYPVWQACYSATRQRPTEPGKLLAAHQYTCEGQIPGVEGRFDLNYGYEELAWRILELRCGLEPQTKQYILRAPDGADAVIRFADRVVDRNLAEIKSPTTLKIAAAMCRHCGISPLTASRLLEYEWADDLYRKLYSAMLAREK